MLDEGLADCAKNIHPVEFEVPSGDRIQLFVESITISQPQVPATCISARNKRIYPTECRQRASTYTGACTVGVGWAINGVKRPAVDKSMGEIPVMIRVWFFTLSFPSCKRSLNSILYFRFIHLMFQSKACNLSGLTPKQLVERGEHENEWGGYFVMKGHEKLIRMLLMTRKNFPIAVQRNTWRDRGQHFGDTGIMVRTVRTDQTATVSTNNLTTFSSRFTKFF